VWHCATDNSAGFRCSEVTSQNCTCQAVCSCCCCCLLKLAYTLCAQANGSALEATVQFANGSDVAAPNATLVTFLAAVTGGSFATVSLHALLALQQSSLHACCCCLMPDVYSDCSKAHTVKACHRRFRKVWQTSMSICQLLILHSSTPCV